MGGIFARRFTRSCWPTARDPPSPGTDESAPPETARTARPPRLPYRTGRRAEDKHGGDGDEPCQQREQRADGAVQPAVGDERRAEHVGGEGREPDPQRTRDER